jgi:hypothetical protein
VRALQRRHPQHLEQLFCQSYLEHSLRDPRHQLQPEWQRSRQGSGQQPAQQQQAQQPRAMGTRPQPGTPPAWAEGLGFSALVLLQAGFMAQVKLGELRWAAGALCEGCALPQALLTQLEVMHTTLTP